MVEAPPSALIPETQDEIAKAIGHVVISFNELEVGLDGLIGELVDPRDPDKGEIVCSRVSLLQKLNIATALYAQQEKDEGRRAQLKTLLDRADALNGERNKVVHSELWYSAIEGDFYRRRTSILNRKGLQTVQDRRSPSDVLALAERLRDLSGEIWNFRNSLDTLASSGTPSDP